MAGRGTLIVSEPETRTAKRTRTEHFGELMMALTERGELVMCPEELCDTDEEPSYHEEAYEDVDIFERNETSPV